MAMSMGPRMESSVLLELICVSSHAHQVEGCGHQVEGAGGGGKCLRMESGLW